MKSYSNSLSFLLRATVLKPDAKLLHARTIFRAESKLYSGAANAAGNADANPSAVKPAPLTDLLGRRHDYLRISLTERCNLRCQYCMPAEGVQLTPRPNLLKRDELHRLVNVFASLGVHKLRLTGGEPTLRSDLAEIIGELSSVPGIRTVSMTTNGLVLTRRLPALQRAGLSAINISLDSLRPDRYERMARRPGLPKVLAGIDLALQLGYRPVKVNTVLMRGFNDDEICDFVEFTRDREVEVRFIEFMPFMGNRWDDSTMIPHEEALSAVRERYPRLVPALSPSCDTASVWQVEGHVGRVGFISSMTQPFCSTCNRLRLTADGNLKVCLFGAAEVSLLEAMRAGAADDELRSLIRTALRKKKPQHAALSRAPRQLRVAARCYSTDAGGLTHLDAEGRARMVDVGAKAVTTRTAEAECFVKVAGALAAKRTAELIPLCHPLALEVARVRVTLPRGECAHGGAIRVSCTARASARTGVEMEALTGAAVAALALYDMCKSVDRRIVITDLRVVSKTGGSHDFAEEAPVESGPKLRPHDTTPIKRDETYAPTNLMHF
ncbi:uncharacterized protein Mocs1 isoform X2 [Battus philenor]|uniref:uncharacterized protein Mocs1 isoform X2 n=1 Tax=Battus philenor TaxID=42288 RepID=UPI0035D0C341